MFDLLISIVFIKVFDYLEDVNRFRILSLLQEVEEVGLLFSSKLEQNYPAKLSNSVSLYTHFKFTSSFNGSFKGKSKLNPDYENLISGKFSKTILRFISQIKEEYFN